MPCRVMSEPIPGLIKCRHGWFGGTSSLQYNDSLQMSELSVYLRHAKRNHTAQIDLSHKNLSFIPKQLFSLRNVQHLNLSHNKLQSIEPAIGELYKLKELDLTNNQLTEIPVEISTLPLLSVLRLEGNPLKPNFRDLINAGNDKGDKMLEALRSCFQRDTKEKTPEWLKQGNTTDVLQKSGAIDWDEKIFKVEPKLSRKTDRKNKISSTEQPLPEFKNNVLQIRMEEIEIGQQISMGGFSTIHCGKYCGLDVAVKKVFNPNISEELLSEFHNQISILSKFRHPNIVLLIGATTKPPNLCILMEYCKQGTLYDLLHRRKVPLADNDRKAIVTQVILALQFLHRNGIVHRDIKSHNVLVNSLYQVKLCDFGLAKHKSQLNTGPLQYSGTPTYMSQELFLKKSYDISVDIFALGTLLYQIYAGEIPFHGIDPADIRDKVLKDSTLPNKKGIKKSLSAIINRCRNADASARPGIEELARFEEW